MFGSQPQLHHQHANASNAFVSQVPPSQTQHIESFISGEVTQAANKGVMDDMNHGNNMEQQQQQQMQQMQQMQLKWNQQKFEKGNIPETPPPQEVC